MGEQIPEKDQFQIITNNEIEIQEKINIVITNEKMYKWQGHFKSNEYQMCIENSILESRTQFYQGKINEMKKEGYKS